MKKFVLKLDLHDNEGKRKALKIVSALSGIDSISMDMKDKKLTVIGTVDPVTVVSKLRKLWPITDIIFVGPAKEPEKKDEAKKDEHGKKEGEKKEDEDTKSEELKKEEKKKGNENMIGYVPYRPYYRPMNTYYHVHHSIEEDPNACFIC